MSLPQESREQLLGAQRRALPEVWRAEVRAVLLAYEEREGAASALGVGLDTLASWLRHDPELQAIVTYPG